jgi:hypothetical protein
VNAATRDRDAGQLLRMVGSVLLTWLNPSRVRVGARDVPSLVDADPMQSR